MLIVKLFINEPNFKGGQTTDQLADDLLEGNSGKLSGAASDGVYDAIDGLICLLEHGADSLDDLVGVDILEPDEEFIISDRSTVVSVQSREQSIYFLEVEVDFDGQKSVGEFGLGQLLILVFVDRAEDLGKRHIFA